MEKKKNAYLVLEDGTIYKGYSFGSGDYVEGEVVFNTGITGYQEILTDPSYSGQIVVMTYPQIGNYGTIVQDNESKKPQVRGFIVKEHCYFPNNYRTDGSVSDYFTKFNILGIEGIDTRAITKKIRNHGAMRGYITTKKLPDQKMIELVKSVEDISQKNLVEEVSTDEIYKLKGTGKKIAILDFGMKNNIAYLFNQLDCDVTVIPAKTKADDVLSGNYDLIMISNGPGDPKSSKNQIELTKQLIGKVPICGICLGHQIIALALGMDTFKLKFGHRGGNHPVKDLLTDKVHITTQNHGYAVKNENIPEGIEITHLNLNDNTVEGLRCVDKNIYCVQFHPEAAPGPMDCHGMFKEFLKLAK